MINTAAALKTYFSSFGIPAYTLESVPDEVVLPYITYPLTEPEWNQKAGFYCQVWYPKNKLGDLLTITDRIVGDIGHMKKLDLPSGYVILYPETPLIQIHTDELTQSAYINLLINAYHLPGQ